MTRFIAVAAATSTLPTDDLKAWFEPKPDTKFLLLDEYRTAVGEKDWGRLDDFLMRLGVEKSPRILSSESTVGWAELSRRGWTTEGHSHKFEDKRYRWVQGTHSKHQPGPLAALVADLSRAGHISWMASTPGSVTAVARSVTHRRKRSRLRTEKWIVNKAGEIVSAREVTVQTLSEAYDTTGAAAESFIKFLGIRDESLETAQLSEEQKRKIKLAEDIEQSGLSEDELRAAIIDAAKRKREADGGAGRRKPRQRSGDRSG